MFTAYVAVTITTIVANAGAAGADFLRARLVLANAAELGVAETWIPLLGALKAAGAAGLLLGLLGVRPIGIAAAIGLVVFFIGALATHIRARVFHNLAFPLAYFALAVASLVLIATQ
jgi:DoxX-like family